MWPGQSDGFGGCLVWIRCCGRLVQLRNSKIEELDARFRQHHVRRFQVAVDDTVTMRGAERVCDLGGVAHHVAKRETLPPGTARVSAQSGEPHRQGLSLHVLHHQVVNSVGVTDIVQDADVRVIQRGNRACLTFKPMLQIGSWRKMLRENLDGDRAAQASVCGSVDLTHAAFANFGDKLMGPEPGAWIEGHRYRSATRTARSPLRGTLCRAESRETRTGSKAGTGHISV